MIEFELFNIVFDFMNDNEFMYSCSLVCKDDTFKKYEDLSILLI